jgi:hypothetical protein
VKETASGLVSFACWNIFVFGWLYPVVPLRIDPLEASRSETHFRLAEPLPET